jgi:NAD(P)H dehydrogenase (quinone)
MPEILILFYSRHGALADMARHVARGVERVDGMTARLRTVPDVATKISHPADAVPASGPPYAALDDLRQCHGVIVGSPAYFGGMAAPMKYFLDQTSPLWLTGELAGKPAAAFTSSASQHGGQESTLLTMMLPLLHHGMVLVGLPYTEDRLNTTTTGGSPYGATHVAGENDDRPLSDDEKYLCQRLGERVAQTALALSAARIK